IAVDVLPDTDGDGVSDAIEIALGFNPNDSTDLAGGLDTDGDRIPDLIDAALNNPDSDGDGYLDGFELAVNGNLSGEMTFGDVNGDGTISVADVELLNQIAAGAAELPGNVNERDADINGDGIIDQTDAQLLQGFLDGNPPVIPTANPRGGQVINPAFGAGVLDANGFGQLPALPGPIQQLFNEMFDPANWNGVGLDIN
ncbi:MAG: dockerin type I domain-containing protein, partial [Planctomycetota bacterium]